MVAPVVHSKLANPESWLLAANGPDPLIRMAVAHYQFEAIHPFNDGNGRTGRIHAIRDLLHETIEKCRVDLPKIYSRELVELIFRQPYCKIPFLVDAGIARRQTTSACLQALEHPG